MHVLIDSPATGLVLERVRLGDRVRTVFRMPTLDRALARGADPLVSAALTLHARRLIAPRTRRRLARSLRNIVINTPSPQVAPAGWELLRLAERLQARGPVDARGVALVRVLMTDGAGPLYSNRGVETLVAAAREACEALDLTERTAA